MRKGIRLKNFSCVFGRNIYEVFKKIIFGFFFINFLLSRIYLISCFIIFYSFWGRQIYTWNILGRFLDVLNNLRRHQPFNNSKFSYDINFSVFSFPLKIQRNQKWEQWNFVKYLMSCEINMNKVVVLERTVFEKFFNNLWGGKLRIWSYKWIIFPEMEQGPQLMSKKICKNRYKLHV